MQQVILDFSLKPEADALPTVHAKQGDSARYFQAVLTDGGKEYTIPAGTGFTVWFSGTAGQGNYAAVGEESAFSVDGSVVTVRISPMMTAVKGGGVMCLVMTDGNGEQLSSWDIRYTVEGLPGIEGANAQDTYEAYRDLLAQAVMASQRVTDIAHGGTGATNVAAAQASLRLSREHIYAQVNEQGEKINTNITSYPTKTGVFYVTGGHVSIGVPSNNGILLIFGSGNQYIHLYVSDTGFYCAKSTALTKPTWREMASMEYVNNLYG